MKTDAAVLLDLISDMHKAIPGNQDTTYKTLAAFNGSQGEDFNVISVVNDCCRRLRQFVEMIPNTTPVHRSAFLAAIKTFESNFALRNMGMSWHQFLSNVQNDTHAQAMHFLDYMIQSQEFWKTRNVDVEDATQLLTALEDLITNMKLPDFIRSLLKNDIVKLKVVLANYEKFGEQDYWDKFQKLTGLFGSIYTTLDDQAREQAAPLLQRLISRTMGGLSVSADIAQLATTAFALLPKT